MALLRKKGYAVQPFKCGPDYIDTKFHEAVCGCPSINLDTFMATPEHVRNLFAYYGNDADICIVEGMMGLFDGYDRDKGSSAEIARALDIPVVLVVDAKSAAYSMAPLLYGFTHFSSSLNPQPSALNPLKIAGVIFNKVGSERHFQMLQQVCSDLQIRCFGYLPKRAELEQGSRYLGLDFSSRPETKALVESLEQHVDWRGLCGLSVRTMRTARPDYADCPSGLCGLRALIARNDESFSFLYQETIDAFKKVRYFDPETDVPTFEDIDLLYLPGGYPEKHLDALVRNEACRQAIKTFAEQGGRVVAECGGMMYLCQSIKTDEGSYPMCGVLPYSITARLQDRKLSLGYRRFMLDGLEYRGHEFHYTQFERGTQEPFQNEGEQTAAQVYNAKGEPVATPVFKYRNVLASYTHIYRPSLGEGRGGPLSPSLGEGRGGLSPLMFAGTGSDVGKSIVAAAFCRIFRQDGYHPAPFKAQNMALNSYATPEGLEIGRAQAVQAEAAGIPCHTDMNPLLLKPNSDHTSQVVLHGKPIGNKDAYDFWREGRVQRDETSHSPIPSGGVGGGLSIDFRHEVCAAFDRLAAKYNPIVMEGAGSIAEINLKDRDLVNMSMARHAGANVILVGDIDRGGVFASVYGSIMLQSPEDRQRIKGIIINKFRGDMRLFDEGRRMLEDLCGIPVLGVIPYFKDIYIEEEDSVALMEKVKVKSEKSATAEVNVAVVLLRHISNFTDFNVLERDPRVNLYYTNNTKDIEEADVIILPGTKATLDDLLELRRNGCAQAIQRAHRNGKTIVGICGGYQMLGQTVNDPDGIEGNIPSLPGLGLLPIHTTMTPEKTTRQVSFEFNGETCQGYEIHQGVSDTDQAILETDHCIGTYIHGFLDNAPVIEHLLREKLKMKNEKFATALSNADFKEQQYDKLAAHVRQYVDMEKVYEILRS
jgi:adenosylcobyric acid synthase